MHDNRRASLTKSHGEAERFITTLSKLEPGEKAALRRAAGSSINEAQASTQRVFFRLCPAPLYHREKAYFLVATLYFFNKYQGKGNFGQTMANYKKRIKTKGSGVDRRFMALLDCRGDDDFAALGHHLRQLVKLAASQQVGIDWTNLLSDLVSWQHPERWVQRKWAEAYFGNVATESESADAEQLKEE